MRNRERSYSSSSEFLQAIHDELRAVHEFWVSLIDGPHVALKEYFGSVIEACQAVHSLIEPDKEIEPADLFCTIVMLTSILTDPSSRPNELREMPYDPISVLDLTDIASLCDSGWQMHHH